jgi:predicted ABC-type transport system involved in lysophospholipase L1 biosynthesis ATPase subunit
LGLSLSAAHRTVRVEPFQLHAGEWAVLSPSRAALGPDLAMTAARVFGTLASPTTGRVELFGRALSEVPYLELLSLRKQLGFVPGAGGLLSNRSLRQNVALPVHTHAGLSPADEDALVQRVLDALELSRVADQRPHEVSGATRFRCCVARALVLSPRWLVIEGIGDFEADGGEHSAWSELLAYQRRGESAAVICLGRTNPAFERWFQEHGGRVIAYHLLSELPGAVQRSHGT